MTVTDFRQPERKSSSESSERVVCQSNDISLVRENCLVSFAVMLFAARLKFSQSWKIVSDVGYTLC